MTEKDTVLGIDKATGAFVLEESQRLDRELAPRVQPSPSVATQALTSPQSMMGMILQDATISAEVKLALVKEFRKMMIAEETRLAKKDFDVHFALMQGDFKPIPRSKTARDYTKGKDLYDYAPIETMVQTNGRAIADHGFSYSFREEYIEERKVIRFYIDITGWGHTRTTFVDLPDGAASAPLMNGAQEAASLQSYGHRYSMTAGFGFVMADVDDDARSLTFELGVQYSQEIMLMREATTIDELRAAYKTAWTNKPEDVKKMLYKIRCNREKEINAGGTR
jgi:hypothetical protein